MKKNERLLSSIGSIDEKFIEEAEGNMKKNGKSKSQTTGKIIKMVASIVIVVSLGLFLFWPTYNLRYDTEDFADSQYQPLIEKIEPYRYQATKKPYDNNFELGWMFIQMIGRLFLVGGTDMMAPGDMENEAMSGAYVESTDNQVEGIVEADIVKTTENCLFRLVNGHTLSIYSLAGEDSRLLYKDELPLFEGEHTRDYDSAEMYLTKDGKTVIVIVDYRLDKENGYRRRVGISTVNVENPEAPYVVGQLSIDGYYNTSRLIDDKLLLVSEYSFDITEVDYSNPETYVPRVTRNGEDSFLEMNEIYAPDGVNSSRYSVVASIDLENFEISGVNGLLNFTNSVYVSENNLYITREYSESIELDNNKTKTEAMSDIAVLGYKNGGMDRQIITVSGTVKDQYSMDERDGYFRVVTSTFKRLVTSGLWVSTELTESASLYVIKLSDGSLVASVEDFAPNGEEVASARFDGDTLYVCTAVIVTFTDPVFFFDLSDYSNITYTDTGVIDGFSSSLINLGEGFLLGIGQEDWSTNKVEVYEQGAGAVNSVDVFKFGGGYSDDYKDYLVNREENLFGFEMVADDDYGHSYVLLQFDGYKLNVISATRISDRYTSYGSAFESRGIYRDGTLYIVTDTSMIVVDTTVPMDESNSDAQILVIVNGK